MARGNRGTFGPAVTVPQGTGWAEPTERSTTMRRRPETRRWPDRAAGRPRVVVEYEDDAVAYSIKKVLEAEGYDAAVCPGPRDLPAGHCPLAAGHECELATGADVVVNGLDLALGANRAVLHALHERVPGLPVVVEVPLQRREHHADALEGASELRFPMTRETLVRAVRDALTPG